MRYTKIPADTFANIQMNAGILCTEFNPETGVASGQIGATSGGIAFADAISFVDMGEDIDNCPKNTKELKILDQHEVTMSGTFVAISAEMAALLAGAADITGNKITPRNDVLQADFRDIWFIGDYSDNTTEANGGFIAIKLKNALSTGGFAIQTADKNKGTFAFTFTGHYSITDPDDVPYELYVQQGGEVVPSITFNKHRVTLLENATTTLAATVVPNDAVVTWDSDDDTVATVLNGVITGEGAGNTIISASITVDGVTYDDTCTVIVTAAST